MPFVFQQVYSSPNLALRLRIHYDVIVQYPISFSVRHSSRRCDDHVLFDSDEVHLPFPSESCISIENEKLRVTGFGCYGENWKARLIPFLNV